MTGPARTPYQVCADAGAQFDDALRAIGIHADRSTVHVTSWEDGMLLHCFAPARLTPYQTITLARHLKAVYQ
ncbi:hypothetical protein [Streptomyces sp. WZ-12]|uniref:hypothetical protein n=1 Tax=Streptomyces sp. WZ-12 TaxID=3030210 RepID=UPI002380FDD2|nr:hypothetical protein [Streptomyces sp. WZ-12]